MAALILLFGTAFTLTLTTGADTLLYVGLTAGWAAFFWKAGRAIRSAPQLPAHQAAVLESAVGGLWLLSLGISDRQVQPGGRSLIAYGLAGVFLVAGAYHWWRARDG